MGVRAYFRRKRLMRGAVDGVLSEDEWQEAIDSGLLPEQRCPWCDRRIPASKEAVQAEHPECLRRHVTRERPELKDLGPWPELW